MTSHLIERILRSCGNDLSRQSVLKQATNVHDVELPLLLLGVKVTYTPEDYSPIQQVRMARFGGTKWVQFGDLVSVK